MVERITYLKEVEGKSFRAIADIVGCSPTKVRYLYKGTHRCKTRKSSLSDEQREELINKYLNGTSCEHLGLEYHFTTKTIQNIVKGLHRKVITDTDRSIVKLRDSGCTWVKVAHTVGMSESNVRLRYKRTKNLLKDN